MILRSSGGRERMGDVSLRLMNDIDASVQVVSPSTTTTLQFVWLFIVGVFGFSASSLAWHVPFGLGISDVTLIHLYALFSDSSVILTTNPLWAVTCFGRDLQSAS